MSTQPQAQRQPQTAAQPTQPGPATDFERLINKPHEAGTIEYQPYGSGGRIKLTVGIVQKFVAERTKTGATCSDRDAIRFMMMCQAKLLNPFEGDCYLLGYDTQHGAKFSQITAHQAFLKRAELHPEYDGMDSGIIVQDENGTLTDLEGDFYLPDQKVVGGWATVYCKNRRPTKRRLRRDRFDTGQSNWQKDAAGMICKCAEADALRSTFPTMLGGLYLRQETDINVAEPVAIELPSPSRLVEVRGQVHKTDNGRNMTPAPAADEAAEAEAGLAPEPPAEREKPATISETQQLKEIVEAAGYDFATFIRVMSETGSLKDADSLPDWDAVPKADAERLIRVLRGAKTRPVMLQQFEMVKGGEK